MLLLSPPSSCCRRPWDPFPLIILECKYLSNDYDDDDDDDGGDDDDVRGRGSFANYYLLVGQPRGKGGSSGNYYFFGGPGRVEGGRGKFLIINFSRKLTGGRWKGEALILIIIFWAQRSRVWKRKFPGGLQ